MRKKEIRIGNEVFNFKSNGSYYHNGNRGVFACYERPSRIKVGIYEYWADWASENNVFDFGVSSYNCMMFTLSGKIIIDGGLYAIYITKNRQEIYKI